jgi:hypothetical protein
MAVYAITHKCGHVETSRQLGRYNKTTEKNLIILLGTQLCSECHRNGRAPNWRREVAAAIAMVEASGLPALQGTKKQLIWAQQIRGRFAPEIIALRDRIGDHDVNDDPALGLLMKVIAFTLAKADAGWWIDKTGGNNGTCTSLLRGAGFDWLLTEEIRPEEREQFDRLLDKMEQDAGR